MVKLNSTKLQDAAEVDEPDDTYVSRMYPLSEALNGATTQPVLTKPGLEGSSRFILHLMKVLSNYHSSVFQALLLLFVPMLDEVIFSLI